MLYGGVLIIITLNVLYIHESALSHTGTPQLHMFKYILRIVMQYISSRGTRYPRILVLFLSKILSSRSLGSGGKVTPKKSVSPLWGLITTHFRYLRLLAGPEAEFCASDGTSAI